MNTNVKTAQAVRVENVSMSANDFARLCDYLEHPFETEEGYAYYRSLSFDYRMVRDFDCKKHTMFWESYGYSDCEEYLYPIALEEVTDDVKSFCEKNGLDFSQIEIKEIAPGWE